MRLEPVSKSMDMALVPHDWGRNMVKKAVDAAHDPWFYSFVAGSYNLVFLSCEELCHWNMICDCPQHIRARHADRVKHVNCLRDSRRMADA